MSEVRALSLWQPWASLVAIGVKRMETRSWSTAYRGWLVIHAAAKWDAMLIAIAEEEPFSELLKGVPGYMAIEGDLFIRSEPARPPLGAAVGVARLTAIDSTDDGRLIVTSKEAELGDFGPGRFAWLLEDAVPFQKPIPVKGWQGLWLPPLTLLKAAELLIRYRPKD